MIRPLGDRILVQEETEHGWHTEQHGLVLEQRREANGICYGTVKALGPRVSPALGIKVGDRVHFEAHCGTVIGNRLLVFRQKENLLALVGNGKVVEA